MFGLDLLFCAVLAFAGHAIGAKTDPDLLCSACRVVIDEVQHKISQVDPKKTIEVGSFRVDSQGNQGRYEVPYATSETHLTEVFESLCGSISNSYAKSTDVPSGKKKFTRTSSRNGEALSLSGVEMGADTRAQLRSMCDHLVEEHEEEFISALQKYKDSQAQAAHEACVNIAEVCTEDAMEIPLVTIAEASLNKGDDDDDDDANDDEGDDEASKMPGDQTEDEAAAPPSEKPKDSPEAGEEEEPEDFDDFVMPVPDKIAQPMREPPRGGFAEGSGDGAHGEGSEHEPHSHEEL